MSYSRSTYTYTRTCSSYCFQRITCAGKGSLNAEIVIALMKVKSVTENQTVPYPCWMSTIVVRGRNLLLVQVKSVVDPGFHVGRGALSPLRGERRPPTLVLFGEKMGQNERIGWEAPGSADANQEWQKAEFTFLKRKYSLSILHSFQLSCMYIFIWINKK